MAHGLESRVPLLDHRLIEFAATIPLHIKFGSGRLKHVLRSAFEDVLPVSINNREDKMGFPTPLNLWLQGPLKEWLHDLFSARVASERDLYNGRDVLSALQFSTGFSRGAWGMICLELWQRQFFDQATTYKSLLATAEERVNSTKTERASGQNGVS
jgi:asparagine synthase (glutamine-hydrolysing)